MKSKLRQKYIFWYNIYNSFAKFKDCFSETMEKTYYDGEKFTI